MRKVLITTIAIGFILIPSKLFACSGILDCAFGWTDRTEIREQEQTKRETEADRQATEQQRIISQSELDQAKLKMDADIERIRMEYQKALADGQVRLYETLTEQHIADAQFNRDTQLQTIKSQTELGIVTLQSTTLLYAIKSIASYIFAFFGLFLLYNVWRNKR